ncbi:uncharacterized protein Mb0911c-like [Rhopilema esculentum]|uniref:uncharacterized protein Mb0911c-like n=1 Tax=Rhopilema esculentum TaxID=499914 RepID=UPI0031DD0CB4|eukprot:gene16989-8492_t
MCSHVNPYIFSRDCKAHLEWLRKVFDVEVGEMHYFKEDPKKIMHTCVKVQNGGTVMMADYMPGTSEKCTSDRGSAISLQFERGQGEKYWKKAIENGGTVEFKYEVQFWGSYFGSFVDPFGFTWMIVEMVPDAKETNQESK